MRPSACTATSYARQPHCANIVRTTPPSPKLPVGEEAGDGEARRTGAVGFARDDDLAIALDCDGVRELERAEVEGDPACAREGAVERALGQVAEDAEVPVGVPVLHLADDDDLPVRLDRDVLGAFREVVVRGRPNLERAHPAVAGEAGVEVTAGGFDRSRPRHRRRA
jgi:hypothetical protein